MVGLPAAPAGQAQRDLTAAGETAGQVMMGIVKPLNPSDPHAGGEMIGLVDFRLRWPAENVAYIGLILVAEPYQRRGIGTQTWRLLDTWLRSVDQIEKVRLGVEQFNSRALRFYQSLDFSLTGETNRIKVGDKFVRLLYMEQTLGSG